ncbi:MAG: ABC transporter ATP-binding protein, partial [Flavobacteriaceae bacterium]|nr:ABC transporter ATP-binding protein [Flavobacteriaceae bacterium]
NNLFNSNQTKESFWALKDINFEIKQGEAVGIIGRNGAGKSTLLKILSRITEPTTGRFEINGRVSSLLEVGTGFHPELSGRENIFLNGTILGMKRAEIKTKFDEIVAFSGVEKFIDTPVKHYSSGMKVRLAFSVAAHLEPEILIVDEVLAVGDAEFQKKCLGKMDDVSKNEGRTVIFVSHNLGAVQNLCSKGLLLQDGAIKVASSIEKVILNYLTNPTKHYEKQGFKLKYQFDNEDEWRVGSYLRIQIKNSLIDEEIDIDITAYNWMRQKIFTIQSESNNLKFNPAKGKNKLIIKIQNPGLLPRMTYFDIGFKKRNDSNYFYMIENWLSVEPSSIGLPDTIREDVILYPTSNLLVSK